MQKIILISQLISVNFHFHSQQQTGDSDLIIFVMNNEKKADLEV
jgi:hypothetical protein